MLSLFNTALWHVLGPCVVYLYSAIFWKRTFSKILINRFIKIFVSSKIWTKVYPQNIFRHFPAFCEQIEIWMTFYHYQRIYFSIMILISFVVLFSSGYFECLLKLFASEDTKLKWLHFFQLSVFKSLQIKHVGTYSGTGFIFLLFSIVSFKMFPYITFLNVSSNHLHETILTA